MGFKRVSGNLAKDIARYRRNLDRAKKRIPIEVGTIAVRHFKESFGMQAFNGGSGSWRKRKTSRYSHPLLNQTGSLMNSIRVKSANFSRVIIRANEEYAQIHNQVNNKNNKTWNGGVIPQRQFMGSSDKLTRKTRKIINKHLKRVFR